MTAKDNKPAFIKSVSFIPSTSSGLKRLGSINKKRSISVSDDGSRSFSNSSAF